MDKNELKTFCDAGYSAGKIASEKGKSVTTIRYWLNKYDLKTKFKRKWDEDELREAVSSSTSIHEALFKMKKNTSGAGYNSFRRNVKKHRVDTSHFLSVSKQNSITNRHKLPNAEIFVKNSKAYQSSVKNRVIKDALIEYRCFNCGNCGSWDGSDLILVLDHKNGDRRDNRLENLRFACPNCNSQLPTHCRKKAV
jgi:5-methylcytosine-specific restriction endonuclease McrA